MNKIFAIVILFISFSTFGQSETKDTLKYEYKVEKLKSDFFKDERTVKIYLPSNYDDKQKYPVIYTLDGYELFEITTNYENYLAKYNVIPNCIVVGIFHNDRNYETTPNYGNDINIPTDQFLEGSEKLKNHLYKEIIPLINSNYSVSGFNILVGHSNTATLASQIISMPNNAFQGFIAITPDLLKEQIENLNKSLAKDKSKNLYYFVSSGTKDDKYRLATGKKLDSIFKNNTNVRLKLKEEVYNSGHLDLVVKSLNDALMFMFSDYRNYNDFENKVNEKKLSVSDYLEGKTNSTKQNYGIDFNLDEDDFYYLLDLVIAKKNSDLLEQLFEVGEKNEFFAKDEAYSQKAQLYEEMGLYDEALKNWKLQIEKGYNDNIFYYERPFRIIYEKLDKPKDAIDFLESSIKTYPKGKLIFSYFIAKVCAEKGILKSKGLKNIEYCIKEFKENKKFTLSEAKELKTKLRK
ncbi:alpha/beta hydrolase-fold protein [Lacinutrix sp. MEBiC02404]